MSFSIGIVGLPNVGKSTLFKALTKRQVDASNFPFCTIDPNVGTVAVPDARLDKLAEVYHSEKIVPTIIEFVDIAGLVKDAHKGEGLGNAFLSNIRSVDAICQVVRKFSDINVVHVNGKVDPKSDKETITLELIYADISLIDKRIDDEEPKAKSGDAHSAQMLKTYQKARQVLDKGELLTSIHFSEDEEAILSPLQLLTMKPMLYVMNVDEGEAVSEIPGYLPISAKIEAELSEMNPEEANEYLESLGLSKTGLDRLIKASYKLLNLLTFFTAGPKEAHAWTVRNGATAPEAAGKVHSDFEKGFIRAEVTRWDDIVAYRGEAGARTKGKIRTEGKEYIVKDGEVMYFLASA